MRARPRQLIVYSYRSQGPTPGGWGFGSQPSASSVTSLEVLLRSLPLFSAYRLTGAVDGGKDGGEAAVSGDCGNVGAARARNFAAPVIS
jgi:hypothetical protein